MAKIIKIEKCFDCKNIAYCDPETAACMLLRKIINLDIIDPDCPLEDYAIYRHWLDTLIEIYGIVGADGVQCIDRIKEWKEAHEKD